MDKEFTLAVFICRAQPFHKAHYAALLHAAKYATRLLILVGSATSGRSTRNSWTYEERVRFIKEYIMSKDERLDYSHKIEIRPIADSAYDFHDWLFRAKKIIQETQFVDLPQGQHKIAIIRHYKDDTSYYLNYFPEYQTIETPTYDDGFGATQIREAYFSIEYGVDGFMSRIALEKEYPYLKTWREANKEIFLQLQREFAFVKAYKKSWEGTPYPVNFSTCDAVCVCLGHVLLIKRGRNPGKDQLALPGGFLNLDETFQQGAIRELREETHIGLSVQTLETTIANQHIFDHPLRDPRGRFITNAFLFDLKKEKSLPEIKADDDASEALWLPLQDLEKRENEFFADHAQIIKWFRNRMR